MIYSKPEEKGISSLAIKKYLELLENSGLSTHNIIIAKDDSIVFEKYYEPFTKDYMHRMYSISKSIIALGIGFLEQDNIISLNDKILKYFPDESKNQKDSNFRNQTIRDMLTMATAKIERYWFDYNIEDRVRFYFENDNVSSRPPGTIFQYDSSAAFILCALIERLTGQAFMDYMRKKLFDKIGVSKSAYCLKCPGGHSWGDSGIICTPTDILLISKFILNKGIWNGKQILNEEFLKTATSKLIDTDENGYNDYDSQGYGYFIWKYYGDAFFMNGMGCQFALCYPTKNIIFIYNGDNQGKQSAKKIILDGFHSIIAEKAGNPIKNADFDYSELIEYSSKLKLSVSRGKIFSECAERINNKIFIVSKNNMHFEKFSISFIGDLGVFNYTKDGDDKKIFFGLGKNEFGLFPEFGYSDDIGGKYAEGNQYRYAASGSWIEENKLNIKVQIIDKYFGQLNIVIGFKDRSAGLYINKAAENFLNEYNGYAGAIEE